ncbi:MAG: ribosome-associated protein [Myxococcota bacterium]|jgi:ribosome-associated protein
MIGRKDDSETTDDEMDEDPESFEPSRTQQTQAATDVNRLGLRLSALSQKDLDRLGLPERLRDAIDLHQRMKVRQRGRQNRLIGQLLRDEDHDLIRNQIELLKSGHVDGGQKERGTERWVNRLVEEGDPAVEALIEEYPDADRQRLRQITRNARGDVKDKKTKRARRDLLLALREVRK